MARDKRHVLKGYPLWTINASEAATFESAEEARIWVMCEGAAHPAPMVYLNANIKTVAELKRQRGYETGAAP